MNHVIDTAQHKQHDSSKTMLGFWIYLMTDLVLFATLFAVYAVLRNNTFGGEGAAELFNLPYVLVETIILLTSSFTMGLAILALHKRNKTQVLTLLSITFALGLAFLAMELYEFGILINEGNSWQRSGFLSGFFVLLATHGLHILVGLLWIIVLGFQITKRGLTGGVVRRVNLLSIFWHFLDIVWIFIFTFVFLIGVAK